MKNPYNLLGVPETASDDEVKKAYRRLMKANHPDLFQDPAQSVAAGERSKEINEAYDTIVKWRGEGGGSFGSGSGGVEGDGRLSMVRGYINEGRLQQAEELLQQIHHRTAEWHYLKGLLSHRQGWLTEARANYARACQMEPRNQEYRNALNFLNQEQRGAHRASSVPICCCIPGDCCDCCCLGSLCGSFGGCFG